MGFVIVCVAILAVWIVGIFLVTNPVWMIPAFIGAVLYAGLIHDPLRRSRPIRWMRRHI